MATIQQVQKGLAMFVDRELQPKVSGRDKWILAGAVTMLYPKVAALADANGNIDINAIIEGIRPAAKVSPANITIPFGGTLSLNETDLDKLKEYINLSA